MRGKPILLRDSNRFLRIEPTTIPDILTEHIVHGRSFLLLLLIFLQFQAGELPLRLGFFG